MSIFFPEPYFVGHIMRREDLNTLDSHGNHPTTISPVVIRKAMSVSTIMTRARTNTILSGEYADRIETTLFMAVKDISPYAGGDQVLCFGTVSGSDYVDGTAYWIDGDPMDSRYGPWEKYTKLTGGIIKLRRVT